MKTAALIEEYLVAMRRMTLDQDVSELKRHGATMRAIGTVCPAPAKIILDARGNLYQPHESGFPAWIFPVCCVDPRSPEMIEAADPLSAVASGPVIDLVAFWCGPRGRALRHGVGTVLGAIPPQDHNADPVRVYRDPIGWLGGSCRGIVLLTDEPFEAQCVLRQCRWIEAEDATHAAELRRLIGWSPPPPVDLDAAE
jgi:hypothetical protein